MSRREVDEERRAWVKAQMDAAPPLSESQEAVIAKAFRDQEAANESPQK